MLISNRALQRHRHNEHITHVKLHGKQITEMKELLGFTAGLATGLQPSQGPKLMPHESRQNMVPLSNISLTSKSSLGAPSQRFKGRDSKLSSNAKRKEIRRHLFETRFRIPKRSTNDFQAWELFAYHRDSSWKFIFRAYNIVPAESAILEHVQQGNIEEIRGLFNDRKASPFDRDQENFTLLDVNYQTCFASANDKMLLTFVQIAARFHQLNVCRLLIELNADPNVSAYE
jgi:hypothetical protein